MPRKTQPHLCFEITSEDGFNVQADSIDGEKETSRERRGNSFSMVAAPMLADEGVKDMLQQQEGIDSALELVTTMLCLA